MSKNTRSMRIIALPLSRRAGGTKSTTILDTYYHFVTPPPPSSPSSRINWANWVTTKASSTWAEFGKAKAGSWKQKTYQYGERLVDRLDFEELALKSLDPSMGPNITRPMNPGSKVDQQRIPILYPRRTLSTPIPNLQILLERRTPRHKRGFWLWLLAAPLTAPFMIIPLIPNLPFFFCIWRSWHHYKAFRASQYLEFLLKRGAIIPEASSQLDQFYGDADHARDESGSPELLLTRDAVPRIQQSFKLPTSFCSDMYRALAQASIRLHNHENGVGTKS